MVNLFSVLQEDLKSPTFLQDKLKQYFLENTHRLTLVMTPDVRTYVCVYVRYVHTYVCVCMYVCMFVCLCTCMYVRMKLVIFILKGSEFFAKLHVYIYLWP